MRRVVMAIAVVVVLGGCTTTTTERSGPGPSVREETTTTVTEPAVDTSPRNPPLMYLSGPVAVPDGEPGKLSIIAYGAETAAGRRSLPVAVRNRTSDVLSDIDVAGTARAADGSLATSGSSIDFYPSVLEPGEWAFGYVLFNTEPPPGSTFDLTATADVVPAGRPTSAVAASIEEVNAVPGERSTSIVGIVSNPTDEPMTLFSVGYLCVSPSGALLESDYDFVDSTGELPPGGTTSFSIDRAGCPLFVLVAEGRSAHR